MQNFMKNTLCKHLLYMGLMFAGIQNVHAEIPTALTDKIYKGDGVIDLFIDVTAFELDSYLTGTNGELFLGVDLNEASSGNETSTSIGVAIKSMELSIQTSDGDFSFTEFYTNTTAMIMESGATESQEFYTMFGKNGSSQINGSSALDPAAYDDIVEIKNINYTGEIISATMSVEFLNTAKNGGESESFFDYSAGYEDFAIFTYAEAYEIETTATGIAEAPSTVEYTVTQSTTASVSDSSVTKTEEAAPATPSGAPEPPFFILLLGLGMILMLNKKERLAC
jgi:hypothetical protein